MIETPRERGTVSIHVEVDQLRCVGSQSCVNTAPGVFAIGANGKSEVVGHSDDLELLEEAEDNCPVSAISVQRTAPAE